MKVRPTVQRFSNLTNAEIRSLQEADQVFSDCYLLASLHALSGTNFGKKILKKNIQKVVTKTPYSKQVNSYNVTFNDVYGKKEVYNIRAKSLGVSSGFLNLFNDPLYVQLKQKNPIVSTMELAMEKLVNNHFFKKPIISRLYFPFLFKNFEFNLPSNFLRTFTGVKPTTIGEKSLNISLKPYRDEVMQLFKKMSENKHKYSFVAGTGLKRFDNKGCWHCFAIEKCDYDKQELTLRNKRAKKPTVISFDTAIKKFKFITGYFENDFKI